MEQLLGLPPEASAHAHDVDSLIVALHWLMFVLFTGWGTFYVYTLIRFRKARNPKANYSGVKSHLSSYLEIGVAIFEAVLLVGFSVPMWSKRVDAFPAEKDALVVRIVAEQFAWNIHYPGPDGKFGKTSIKLVDTDNPLGLDRTDPDAKDDITTINQFNLPVNKPVIVHLSSKDVIHSLNLPTLRVKQDAIPGQSIPVWFIATKTTDEVRNELRHPFSITSATKSVRKISLPGVENVTIKKGSSMDDMLLTNDYSDASGTMILSKGEALNTDNVTRLVDAGATQVSARRVANLDRFVIMEDYKDNTGTVVVTKNESLTEDAVTRLLGVGVKEVSARPGSNVDTFVLMETYNDKSGQPIAATGDAMSEELITKFAEAGIDNVVVAPATPTEIACAQLCGLGHFRMRGYMTIQTPEQFKQWYDEQAASVTAQFATSQSTEQAVQDTSAAQPTAESLH